MKQGKNVRCLYVAPIEKDSKAVSLDLQEALCHTFASKQGWSICNESYASLFFDDKVTPNLFQQLIDICRTAVLSEFNVLLIASRSYLDVPEAYVEQVLDWLHENNVETWSVAEGRLA